MEAAASQGQKTSQNERAPGQQSCRLGVMLIYTNPTRDALMYLMPPLAARWVIRGLIIARDASRSKLLWHRTCIHKAQAGLACTACRRRRGKTWLGGGWRHMKRAPAIFQHCPVELARNATG
jgi:hypothetical protein